MSIKYLAPEKLQTFGDLQVAQQHVQNILAEPLVEGLVNRNPEIVPFIFLLPTSQQYVFVLMGSVEHALEYAAQYEIELIAMLISVGGAGVWLSNIEPH